MSRSLKPAYIEKIDQLGDLQVWVVDGTFIRSYIDEEFTNYGQHYRFTYIPANELWLDREAAEDEQQFFIDHLLVEHRLMSKGVPYEKALVEADRAERKERRRAGDISQLTRHGRRLPEASQVHKRLWKKLEDGISVWIVSGRLVRSVFALILLKADMITCMNLSPKTKYGLMMTLRKGSEVMYSCTNFMSAIVWPVVGLTVKPMPNPVASNTVAAIILINYMKP